MIKLLFSSSLPRVSRAMIDSHSLILSVPGREKKHAHAPTRTRTHTCVHLHPASAAMWGYSMRPRGYSMRLTRSTHCQSYTGLYTTLAASTIYMVACGSAFWRRTRSTTKWDWFSARTDWFSARCLVYFAPHFFGAICSTVWPNSRTTTATAHSKAACRG